MAINTDIWGAPDTWIQQTATAYAKGNIYTPATTDDTYRELYNNDKLALNTIDESQFFYGIGKDCIWNTPYYLSPWYDGENVHIDVRQVTNGDRRDKPLMFQYNSSSASGSDGIRYSFRYGYDRTSVMGTTASAYPNINILQFDYDKTLLIPIIVAVGNDYHTGAFSYYSIEEYQATGYTSKPRVIGFGYRVRFGAGGDDDPRTSAINSLYPMLDIQIPHRDVTYYDSGTYKYFWVPRDMGILHTSDNAADGVIPFGINVPRARLNATVGDGDTAFAYKYCGIGETTAVPLYYFNPDDKFEDNSPIWTLNTDTHVASGITYWHAYPYIAATEDNIDEIIAYAMKQIAFLGMPFVTTAPNSELAQKGKIGDVGVYLPQFDENGITTGKYFDGVQSLSMPNAQWVDSRGGAQYDPNRPPPAPDSNDSGDLSNAGIYLHRFGAEGLTIWAFSRTSLGGNGLDAAIDAITDLYLTDPDGNEKWQLDFKGSNPDDYIVSLMAFPLRFTLSESSYTFKLGPVDFESIDVQKYADTGFFTFGSVTVPAYGDFRDFAPYTTAELYIPFCGTCDIDMAFFAGRALIVDMYYDIYTGSCAAAIYRYTSLGKTLYKVINGQIGVEIPLSSARMGDYQNTLHALETAQKQNDIRIATSVLGMGITAGATIATGGATLPLLAAGVASTMGVVSSVQKSDEINYQLDHTQPKPTQTTAASTQNNFCVGGTRCMLFIKRAHMDSGYDADIYGKTKGFACLINNTVGDNSGLTVCSNIDTTGIPATADEINAIKQAFASGVII